MKIYCRGCGKEVIVIEELPSYYVSGTGEDKTYHPKEDADKL